MNAEKRFVLVIDMQNDFITGTLGTAEARRIVPVVAARIEAERAAGAMLVFTRDTHGNDYMQSLEGKLLPVAHCEQGSAGWALAPEIAPLAEGARIIDKPTFGCVALPELLRPHVGPETEFLLMGLCTDICVVSNALLLRAYFPGNRIFIAPDCCAGVTPESHAAALTTMQMCQIEQA